MTPHQRILLTSHKKKNNSSTITMLHHRLSKQEREINGKNIHQIISHEDDDVQRCLWLIDRRRDTQPDRQKREALSNRLHLSHSILQSHPVLPIFSFKNCSSIRMPPPNAAKNLGSSITRSSSISYSCMPLSRLSRTPKVLRIEQQQKKAQGQHIVGTISNWGVCREIKAFI